MRHISSSILEKINKLRQTRAENADPKINLIMQRTHRYIEQGSLFSPTDIFTREGLGSACIIIPRDDRLKGPEVLYLVYVESGQAHIAWIDYLRSIEDKGGWEYLCPIGPAVAIAAEYNGHWERTSPEAEVCFDSPAAWTLVTVGEPYFFIILPSGKLIVQHGVGGPIEALADSGVTSVAAIRGWKNVYRWNHDQGLICAYIRNGKVCYRNWANQGTEQDPLPADWEPEREVIQLPYPAQNVALFRTNDFRVGFLCESDGELHWAVTDRNWAGMGIRDHTLIIQGTDLLARLITVEYVSTSTPHTVTIVGAIETLAMIYALADNTFVVVENDGPETIYATTQRILTGLTAEDFTVLDDDDEEFRITDIEAGEGPCHLVLTVDNLNHANQNGLGEGDLTLHFLGSGDTKGEAGQNLDPFSFKFTPEGLEFIATAGPKVEAIWNE